MNILSKLRKRLMPPVKPNYTGDYMADYRRHTDQRVERDPHEAIGGMWSEIGQLQIDFLRSEGLEPSNTLLDIGCGTLRGGRHFIRYLDAGNYAGTEMSAKALEAARALIRREGLESKSPRLIHVPDGNLRLDDVPGTFDYILAQSVFTHLMEPLIEECLANVRKVMTRSSRFYFTFLEADDSMRLNEKDFAYPFSYFVSAGAKGGLDVENVSLRYPHPRQQRMALARLA